MKHYLSTTTLLLLTSLPLKAQTPQTWQPMDCPFPIPQGEAVDCGLLTVPENRETPSSQDIQVFFARIRSYATRPQPDPVVFLAGGPGQASSDFIESTWSETLALRRDRDIILVDQRGTGQSKPDLSCEEFQEDYPPEVQGNETAELQWTLEKTKACRDRLVRQKIDLRGYNTRQAALDLRALREALNLSQWNLVGTSYGTKLALETLRQDPSGIRTIVFNSMMTPGDAWDVNSLEYTIQTFEQIFNDCERDRPCQEAYPNLRHNVEQLKKRLTESPVTLSWYDPETGNLNTRKFRFYHLIESLIWQLTFAQSMEKVPLYFDRFSQLINGQRNLREEEIIEMLYLPDFGISDGLYFSVSCQENYPMADFAATAQFSRQNAPWFRPEGFFYWVKEQCRVWNVPPLTPALNEPIPSDLPVLFLTGGYDSLTPPQWTEEVRQSFPQATVIQIPFMGHDLIGSSYCVKSLVIEYLQDPKTELNTRCLVQHAPRFDLEKP